MAKTTFNMADGILTPCNVACGSEIVTVNSPSGAPCSGMTFHWIRPNVRHIGILLLVLILTVSPQSTCHSGPVWEILSKSDHPRQKKSNACLFSRWRISAILDFRGPIMGSLKSPRTTSYRVSIDTIATRINCFVFEKIAFLRFGDRQTNKQMDKPVAWSRSRYRERRLNKPCNHNKSRPACFIDTR